MKELRLWANYYYNMGFNVTHIIPNLNEGKAKNPYKSPTNNRHTLKNRRQTIDELNSYDWEHSTGIGVVLGFNNLRAIDFDFSRWNRDVVPDKRNQIINLCLQKLDLPNSYEWVIITPNGGFHILFYSGHHNIPVKENLTRAFTPNEKYYNYCDEYHISAYHFKQIELRWEKHLVLPPSTIETTIHQETDDRTFQTPFVEFSEYDFYSKNIPKNPPFEIFSNDILNLLNEICYDEYDHNLKSGYNLHLSNYYDDNDVEGIKFYTEGEFLDLSPIYFKKDENNTIPDDWLK